MSNIVTLNTRDLKVRELEQLRKKYIDHYERPLDAAIRLGDLDAFKIALEKSCQEAGSFHYNERHRDQWARLRVSEASFEKMLKNKGPSKVPGHVDVNRLQVQYVPDMEEFKLITLGWAMEHSKLDLVDMLLRCDIDVWKLHPVRYQGQYTSGYDDDYGAILHNAARYSTPAVCSTLLQQAADVYQETEMGRTPLDCAVHGLNHAVIGVLCPNAILLDRQDSDGCTPLLKACNWWSGAYIPAPDAGLLDAFETVKRLASYGADVKVKDKEQNNALHGAACQYNTALAKWLVEMGVEAHETNIHGMTPLQKLACKEPRYRNYENEYKTFRPRMEAIYRYLRSLTPSTHINDIFLSPQGCKWADPRWSSHQTLLSAAIATKNWALTDLLCEEGATCPAEKINDSKWLKTALKSACHQGRKTTFSYLLRSVPQNLMQSLSISEFIDGTFIDRGCRYHGVGSYGSLDDYVSILATILESGFSVQPSAFHMAIKIRSPPQLIRALLSFHHGLEQGDWNSGSHDMLLMVALQGRLDNFLCVLEHIRSNSSIQSHAWWFDMGMDTRFESMQAVTERLAEKLNQNDTLELHDEDGMTPLHRAAQYNNAAMVRALLQYGPDIDALRPRTGLNALISAVQHGSVDAVHALLKAGSSPNAVDTTDIWAGRFEYVPLVMAACNAHYIGTNDIVLALLEHGAKVNVAANFDPRELMGVYHSIGRFDTVPFTALAAAFEKIDAGTTPTSPRQQICADSIRSITHKAVRDRLPSELTDMIADQLLVDRPKQSRELIKILIKYGANPAGVANATTLSQICLFDGGYEELWDDHLRIGIHAGKERVYNFDPTL